MNVIKTINVFDFDETLVRCPTFSSKKIIEKEYPDIKFEDPMSFYDNEKSLCENLYHIQVIEPVYEEWKNSINDPNSLTVLITNRKKELEKIVLSILDKRNIQFDRTYFLGRTKNKSSILEMILNSHPEIEKVRVFEDSIQQLDLYQKFFKNNKKYKIRLEMYIVDKSRLFKISNFNLTNEKRIRLL